MNASDRIWIVIGAVNAGLGVYNGWLGLAAFFAVLTIGGAIADAADAIIKRGRG